MKLCFKELEKDENLILRKLKKDKILTNKLTIFINSNVKIYETNDIYDLRSDAGKRSCSEFM